MAESRHQLQNNYSTPVEWTFVFLDFSQRQTEALEESK